MSRQAIMDRKGGTFGYIDTAADGKQTATGPDGALIGRFDPSTGQTFDAGGHPVAEGNSLPDLVRAAGA